MPNINEDVRRVTLRVSQAEAAAITQAAAALHLSENSYMRRALQVALRLDVMTEEPAAYQTWFRDGLSDLFAAANASAVLAHATLSLILDRLSSKEGDPLNASREEIMAHLIDQARATIPTMDTAMAWRPDVDLESAEFDEFWQQVQGARGGKRKKKSIRPL